MIQGSPRRLGLITGALCAATVLAGCASAFAADVTTVNMVLWPGPEGDAMQKVVDAWNKDQGAKQNIQVKMILLSRDDTFSRETTEIAAAISTFKETRCIQCPPFTVTSNSLERNRGRYQAASY